MPVQIKNNNEKRCVTKAIEGTGGNYFADEDGNIYSVLRDRSRGGALKPGLRNRYLSICIFVNGEWKSKTIHRIIAQTFIPNPDNLPFVNHKNGIRTDNRKVNLEWCTGSQNMKHAYDVLKMNPNCHLRIKGEGHASAKLKDADVYELYEMIINGQSIAKFGTDKRINITTVKSIIEGKSWSHLNLDWSIFKKINKEVYQLDAESNTISSFGSVTEAANITGVNRHCIYHVLKGRFSTAGGFSWKYKNN